MKSGEEMLLDDALRLKRAELWLQVQQPVNALEELLRVTEAAWQHPWTLSIFQVLATRVLKAR
jgi:hypothetical protein